MKLVIAEKPSVAQSLAAVLGANQKKQGYLEGGGWLVNCHCVGTMGRSSYVQLEYLGSYASAGASPTKCPTHQLTSQPPPSKYPCFF